MKKNLVKHESGYFIADPVALRVWRDSHRDPTGKRERFMALVPMLRCRYVTVTGVPELHDPSGGEDKRWVVAEVYRDSTSPIYFEVSSPMFRYEIGKVYYSGCWFSTDIFPLELLRSPARLLLESKA